MNDDFVETSSCGNGHNFAQWIFYYILSPPVFLVIAITIQALLVHSLFAPAKVTSACQRLGSAVFMSRFLNSEMRKCTVPPFFLKFQSNSEIVDGDRSTAYGLR